MAMKIPVISTNTGGLPEVNIHGVTGYLSKVGDVEDMTRNALNILENEAVLATMSENAFRQAEKFDITRILPLYEDLYTRTKKTSAELQA